ncbi:alpha/beta-Hydrolases superfamily protein [Prunus dulcis]|uniref:Alpha/beta-Hydrolases superfamily protein n=1 Tax=Prunus dulcis TaxID=3755 RepID=A0A5H2XUA8_PRUDU|nr:alpha/beta-Hydrolases superfamily protein [Prunus dulcis]
MAKGIKNGIPLGAVVITPKVAEVLTRCNYFNTFGGNPIFLWMQWTTQCLRFEASSLFVHKRCGQENSIFKSNFNYANTSLDNYVDIEIKDNCLTLSVGQGATMVHQRRISVANKEQVADYAYGHGGKEDEHEYGGEVWESTGNEGEEIKRANWGRGLWNSEQKQFEDEEEDNNNGEEGCCVEGCSLEEKNGEMGYKSYDPESFSRFLVRVPWSETKLFSKLAFLCNMVYVIPEIKKAEAAAYMAAPTMTVVVAASESEKHETTKDFRAGQHSSPCEWFVCDDSSTFTRCFVVQGLDSHASWQAYLLFEPTKFEGTNVLVHRGIYEASEAILYEQSEILDHLERKGEQEKFQFTGHCIGGSIALLVHLMLLTRNLLKPSTLRPAVTFGSPFVFCKGHKILEQLSLDEGDHIHCVMMHRDIVPRAFSSNYNNQKRLYSPMGNLFILQPDEKSSPPHPLLPPGSALYVLNKTQCGSSSGLDLMFQKLVDPKWYHLLLACKD